MMEKFSTLTEQDVKRITNLVKEQVDVSEYDDSDFIEVFVKYFRPWIKKFHGDEVSEYPMSHLVKKYTADFIKDHGIEIRDRYYSNDLKKLVDIGKSLVVKGTHNLPSLKKEGRFLEKYDKGLTALIEYLDLPKFMKIKFREDKPYNVGVWIEANFDEMLKYDGEVKDNSKYMDELKNYISSFLGVEYGSPAHGNLQLVTHGPILENEDEWVKNVFNKKIKTAIRNLPNAKGKIHSTKLNINRGNFRVNVQLTFRQGNWRVESDINKGIKDLLLSMGYNPKRIALY
jgi:hypothetical protein